MLRHLAVLTLTAGVTPLVAACGKKSCMDVTGLTPEEVTQRTQTAAYVDNTMDASKKCSLCAQFVAPASEKECGGCKVLKGPVSADGYCKLFAPKKT